ncbi:similar to Saccharomyces cerevisiae YLR114C AVL9 Conserved protein involved in exocytic transport from the Golgi [Maudiozyma barnettii]|uniref:Similar to Saccharomyces cerevisiae YLR114C AVL9 Conserved protein involved in exocytic transport from the Golgi n=1 Tax=Maudiozyma barnettii TaxID=61262 RepID=A0A8H2VHF6_9SACH|nr:Avl9p [Kazachstania barnettii]CAB4255460.1 similar to Saccharomyces cerevisiae YLR114C AVL9 Conserved protein involved in exocytic transport from the Golgi [Kazachstania barnettii]CAD1783923.1 similar to Saccharomyces cerevisiae YLR114C AVL9 Conserved protein involved in exocytic transport from the Golgi [Kazachstania barnettii]
MENSDSSVIFGICLVDFHHKRGPEIEYWHGLPDGVKKDGLWTNLPFQALPDGSHSFEETFTYFTLLYDEDNHCSPINGATELSANDVNNYSTLFAISCSRQIKTDDLLTKDKDVTRSTVQKAIVVVFREPIFGQIRDKLSIVTNAYFLQHDFTDKQILVSLYDNLKVLYKSSSTEDISNSANRLYIGLCLRKVVHDFKKDVLILLKAMILEKKIIFYGSNVEYLCNLQFSLISLIPSLLLDLRDSGSPLTYKDISKMERATSFKSSDRKSVLKFLGLPLQIFQKGGLFSPYTPLQQVDDIKSEKTNFFVVGSSNSLLFERRDELCDILVNVDTLSLEIINKSLDGPLQLTGHDKKWIESIVAIVEETWNENDDETPKNSQFKGSEDFIRWQFEDYITGLLSSVKLFDYVNSNKDNPVALQSIPQDYLNLNPWSLYNIHWVNMWETTRNYEIFNKLTDDRLFDLFVPKHAYNGVDNFVIFQQKLISAFQNLRKHPSTDAPSNKSIEDEQVSKVVSNGNTVDNEKKTHNDNEPIPKENVWSSWKDYFNRKKIKNNEDATCLNNDTNDTANSVISKGSSNNSKKTKNDDNTTNTNLQQNSTRKAIENALLGLGLHRDNHQRDLNESSDDDDNNESFSSAKVNQDESFSSKEQEKSSNFIPRDENSNSDSMTADDLILTEDEKEEYVVPDDTTKTDK